jgi:hypothetical protein
MLQPVLHLHFADASRTVAAPAGAAKPAAKCSKASPSRIPGEAVSQPPPTRPLSATLDFASGSSATAGEIWEATEQVEGEAMEQVEGEASGQRGSRSTADEGPRASSEGPLAGLAPPQDGGDLEVHGRRDPGFGRREAGWIEQDDLGCVQGGSSRGRPRAGRIDLRIDAGRCQRSSHAGVVGGRAGRSGSSREAFAPKPDLSISTCFELGPATLSPSSFPGFQPLVGGNYREAMREGGAPPLEAVLLCAMEASAYCRCLQMSDGDLLETV